MNRLSFLRVSIIVMVLGCGDGRQPAGDFPQDVPNDFLPVTFKPEATKRIAKDAGPLAAGEIALAGEKWKRVGPESTKRYQEIQDIPGESSGVKHDFGGKANVDFYEHGSDPNRRVVLLKMVPFADGLPTAGWTKVLIEQKRVADNWIHHGALEQHFDDGRILDGTNADGVPHGWLRVYYPSGQLEQETPWVNGKKQGRGRLLYESGIRKKEYVYKDDQESKARELPEKKG